jgi:hypothetical protein
MGPIFIHPRHDLARGAGHHALLNDHIVLHAYIDSRPLKVGSGRVYSAELFGDRLGDFSKIRPKVAVFLGYWRREWDSNPRYAYTHTRFPSVRLKPLGHLSRARRRSIAAQGRPENPDQATPIRRPSSARPETPTAEFPPYQTGASAFCLPSASPAACACAKYRRRSISRSRPSTAR